MSTDKSFAGKSLLVVGGAGFVGSNLIRMLLRMGPQKVTIVDNFLSSERINIPNDDRINLINGDRKSVV